MASVTSYRDRYYRFQTEARGLKRAPDLHTHFRALSRWYAARLQGRLPSDRSAPMLDCACGYGNFSYFLRGQGYTNVRAIDLDPRQVELARLVGVPAEVADAFSVLESARGEYACIAAVDFFEHLTRDEAIRFLDLAYAALAADGVLVLRTPCADSPFGGAHLHNDLTHEFGVTSNLLRAVLRMAGFVETRILDERPQWKPPYALAAVRVPVFHAARAAASGFCRALGLQPPEVWSSSMWAVARRA